MVVFARTSVRRPPGHQLKHRGQIAVDRIASPTGQEKLCERFYGELTRPARPLGIGFINHHEGRHLGCPMTEKPPALPLVNEGSEGVIDFNDKAQAYLCLAAQHAQRAAKATDPKLTAAFLKAVTSKKLPRMMTRRIEMILPGGWAHRPANRRKRPLWAELIFALDRWLQRRQGVFEYTHKPDCIFRVQLGRLHYEVVLSDGTLGRPGDQVIDLHLWNEQIPAIPVAGPSLAWGRRFSRCFAESLHELARFLISEPELLDITIIRANTNLDSLHRIAARHEFETILDPVRLSPWESVHRFGENTLYWLLTLACNSGGAWPNTFWRSRKWIYLSRRVLERKHVGPTMLAATGRSSRVGLGDAGT
jgi:hypothetical protein